MIKRKGPGAVHVTAHLSVCGGQVAIKGSFEVRSIWQFARSLVCCLVQAGLLHEAAVWCFLKAFVMLSLHGNKWAQAWAVFRITRIAFKHQVFLQDQKGLWITNGIVWVSKGGAYHSANRGSTIPWRVAELWEGGCVGSSQTVGPQGCVLPLSGCKCQAHS